MQKKGSHLPIAEWMRNEPLNRVVEERLERLKKRGLFAQEEISRRLDGFYAHRLSYAIVWQLVSVEMWLEAFMDGRGSEPKQSYQVPL